MKRKLTESRLRSIIREELSKLNEASKSDLVWLDDILVASLNGSEPVAYPVTKNNRSMDISAGIGVDIGHQGMGILLGNSSRTSWIQNLIDEVEYKGKYSLDVRVAPSLRLEGDNYVSMRPVVVDDVVSSPQPLADAARSGGARRADKNSDFLNRHGQLYAQEYNMSHYVDKVAAIVINDGTDLNQIANTLEGKFKIVEVLERFNFIQVFPDPFHGKDEIENLLPPGVDYELEYSKPRY
jgi:hypothetical protein